MKKLVLFLPVMLLLMLTGTSCRKSLQYTTVNIKDSIRHYYPIKRGQQLDIMFQITNTGNEALIIHDIQPSCGCIVLDKSSHIVIPEHHSRQFHATYNSSKNVGEVMHHIRIYGNILPKREAELSFQVNVVPDASYTRDYEELYQNQQKDKGSVKRMVDGTEAERGYYIDGER
ncbi:MAG: DUF1573 domain-containing protein [Prevotellaceae bacterium]|jgi:hypothetical protein|nr:DUF1573 domain-containing protein [Prevotellaceae bacterium]